MHTNFWQHRDRKYQQIIQSGSSEENEQLQSKSSDKPARIHTHSKPNSTQSGSYGTVTSIDDQRVVKVYDTQYWHDIEPFRNPLMNMASVDIRLKLPTLDFESLEHWIESHEPYIMQPYLIELLCLIKLRHSKHVAMLQDFHIEDQAMNLTMKREDHDLESWAQHVRLSANIKRSEALKEAFEDPFYVFDIIASSLFKALNDIHHMGIVHGDIKPNNILISSNTCETKICDFSLSNIQMCGIDQQYNMTMVRFQSPEQMCGLGWNQSSDLWALGLVLLGFWLPGDRHLSWTPHLTESHGKAMMDIYDKVSPLFRVAIEDESMDVLRQDMLVDFHEALCKVHQHHFGILLSFVPKSIKPLFDGLLDTNRHERWSAQQCLEWMTHHRQMMEQMKTSNASKYDIIGKTKPSEVIAPFDSEIEPLIPFSEQSIDIFDPRQRQAAMVNKKPYRQFLASAIPFASKATNQPTMRPEDRSEIVSMKQANVGIKNGGAKHRRQFGLSAGPSSNNNSTWDPPITDSQISTMNMDHVDRLWMRPKLTDDTTYQELIRNGPKPKYVWAPLEQFGVLRITRWHKPALLGNIPLVTHWFQPPRSTCFTPGLSHVSLKLYAHINAEMNIWKQFLKSYADWVPEHDQAFENLWSPIVYQIMCMSIKESTYAGFSKMIQTIWLHWQTNYAELSTIDQIRLGLCIFYSIAATGLLIRMTHERLSIKDLFGLYWSVRRKDNIGAVAMRLWDGYQFKLCNHAFYDILQHYIARLLDS